jgi:rare lipoprotein A (peptidoglycan hydrolase)
MSNATEAKEIHSNVMVYPNPVGPDYTGLIAVKGLVNNAYVKITDIKGQMVYETRANGGMATWDGRNFTGKRTATGVYLIYSTNAEGSETNVAKVVFIN